MDQATLDLAAKAMEKRKAGQEPNTREVRALQKFESAQDEADLERLARAVPKKTYVTWSGNRKHQVLDDQADRYGIPLRGPVVNIPDVLKWLHDFLASNKYRFIDDDPDIAGASSPALERCRQLKAEQLQIELDKMRGTVVDVSVVRDCLGQLATQLRAASDRAENLFGLDGRELLTQVIDAVCASISKLEDHGDDDQPKQ